MKQILLISFIFTLISCNEKSEKLPYLGNHVEVTENGQSVVKKHFEVPEFKFVNQDKATVTNKTFKGKIYIADFIFLRCPTICPVMNLQMKRVYDAFKEDEQVLFVSHTIDPENDSVEVLKAYADKLGVDSKKWHFLHGDKKEIYDLAEKGYFAQAYEDMDAPGGFAHSGGFVLVDEKGHLRGVYNGTNAEDVDRLMKEVVILLGENSK